MAVTIRDEVSGLLQLYDCRPEGFAGILEQQHSVQGHLLYNSPLDHGIQAINKYFSERARKPMTSFDDDEKEILEATLKGGIEGCIEKGVDKTRAFFKEGLEDPVVVLAYSPERNLLRDSSMSHMIYVNLLKYARDNHSFEPAEKVAERILQDLQSYVSHESTYAFLSQSCGIEGRYRIDAINLTEALFGIGLATFIEPRWERYSDLFANDFDFWYSTIRKAETAKGNDRKEVLAGIAENPIEKKFMSWNTNRIRETLKKLAENDAEIEDIPYGMIINALLLKSECPLCHVGYKMWNAIKDKHGDKKMRSLTEEGPEAFVQAFEETRK